MINFWLVTYTIEKWIDKSIYLEDQVLGIFNDFNLAENAVLSTKNKPLLVHQQPNGDKVYWSSLEYDDERQYTSEYGKRRYIITKININEFKD